MDEERVSMLTSMLDEGAKLPTVEVYHKDGEFYIAREVELALAYTLAEETLVPAKIIKGEPTGEYVRMGNTL